mmetsp:Transcript_12896/g.23165  ORF Transcript_12896/g.23165 Transcript_12896/m.23165 type:complete len:413 (+) Transcript_12896:114-1352(+)
MKYSFSCVLIALAVAPCSSNDSCVGSECDRKMGGIHDDVTMLQTNLQNKQRKPEAKGKPAMLQQSQLQAMALAPHQHHLHNASLASASGQAPNCDVVWTFALMPSQNLYGILEGPVTGSGKTEVHILSASSNYADYTLQTGTALGYTSDGSWQFTMKSNGDLAGVLKGPVTGSGKTELHVLSAASNYQEFDLAIGTGAAYSMDADWVFAMDPRNANLVGILKGPVTGTGKTEVHTLSASSNYQEFSLEVGTVYPLYTPSSDWQWILDLDDNLVGILKGPVTGTGKTEMHTATAASNYQEIGYQIGTVFDYTNSVCTTPTPAPTPAPTPGPTTTPAPGMELNGLWQLGSGDQFKITGDTSKTLYDYTLGQSFLIYNLTPTSFDISDYYGAGEATWVPGTITFENGQIATKLSS